MYFRTLLILLHKGNERMNNIVCFVLFVSTAVLFEWIVYLLLLFVMIRVSSLLGWFLSFVFLLFGWGLSMINIALENGDILVDLLLLILLYI